MSVDSDAARSRTARRLVLKGLALLPFGLGGAPKALSAPGEDCLLSFRHTHTDERLSIVYRSQGNYIPAALASIDHLLRDFRTGEIRPIDPRLLDLLYALRMVCGDEHFEVISGYRSPATNALLRQTSDGVASHSLHMEGRAIDIRMAGMDTARLCRAARTLRAGGVGYYPASDFVHVDTGRVRTWGPLPS